ncbi:MAG: hypothetical protein PVF17_04525 [Ignavibacteria bacterium]|jgi:hypothetical protein
MNKLTDDILNKYFDGDLDNKSIEEVEDIIKSSESERKKINAFKVLHQELSTLREDQVSRDFTDNIMKRISRRSVTARTQKYFIIAMFSFIILLCLGVVGYVVYTIISSVSAPSEPTQVTETAKQLGNGLITELTKIFSGKNLSIIGSVFSLGILISGYFFFERQKQAKANLGS